MRIRRSVASDLQPLRYLLADTVVDRQLSRRVLDRSILIAEKGPQLLGSIGLDLDTMEIKDFFVDPSYAPEALEARLIAAVEKLAVRFGILSLRIRPAPEFTRLLHSCGYREMVAAASTGSGVSDEFPALQRSLARRQTRYSRQISGLLAELGIPGDYGRIHRIPLQQEAKELRDIDRDIYGRHQSMLPSAAESWRLMSRQAAREDIELQAVSAFRSVEYQAGIVRRKLERGLSVAAILEVSAAPGYSEHHSGRAIDISSPGWPVLEEAFEHSPAFRWLSDHAGEYGFSLSFPRGNRNRLAYEPWHWAWRP